jgi:FMN phosphatase YigB (HAD superfamily)
MPPFPGVDELLGRLAASGRRLAILSNWPLAATVDRYAAARGWDAWLTAIVISQRVGWIKPHPEIFAAAHATLGDPAQAAILHVGDDWAADVIGASDAGWRTGWIREHPADTPLPTSDPDGSRRADVELERVTDLEGHLEGAAAGAMARP